MKNMRYGFTMVELIFVIVILGILAAIAIPKLSATRDDAKTSVEVNNIAACIMDLGTQYTARKTLNTSESDACIKTFAKNCFTGTAGAEGNLTISAGSNTEAWCTQAQTQATNINLIGTHKFGGTSVSY